MLKSDLDELRVLIRQCSRECCQYPRSEMVDAVWEQNARLVEVNKELKRKIRKLQGQLIVYGGKKRKPKEGGE